MTEVIYSINGKYFKDYGVYISESKGLLDKPKPKSRRTYDWAEMHGKQVDLSPTRYDEQDLELKGWIMGQNWAEMKANFDILMSEFDKQGLVRLLVEFGETLVFDVYLSDGIEMNKTFRNGNIIGEFSLKLKNPYPIKRTFILKGNKLEMAFVTNDWLTINTDGIMESVKGEVNIQRDLKKREISSKMYPNRGEDMHYITVSGNVEDMMNIKTNAEQVWNIWESKTVQIQPPKTTGGFSKGFSTGFRV